MSGAEAARLLPSATILAAQLEQISSIESFDAQPQLTKSEELPRQTSFILPPDIRFKSFSEFVSSLGLFCAVINGS